MYTNSPLLKVVRALALLDISNEKINFLIMELQYVAKIVVTSRMENPIKSTN